MRALRSLLLVLLLSLAGCSSESGEPQTAPGDGLVATSETGLIRGVVVDATITPVADAEVRLEGPGGSLATTTDAEGLFGFGELEPGEHRLVASKLGYHNAHAATTVVAGDSQPPIVKLLLEPDPEATPYVQAFKFDGFIECSASFILAGLAACNYVPGSNDEFLVEYLTEGQPMWAQSEMQWDTTQSLSPELSLLYSRSVPDQVLLENWEEAAGVSPLVIQADAARIEEAGLGTNSSVLMVRVFNQHNEGTAPEDIASDPADGDCWDRPVLGGCMRGLGVTIQQEFTVYTHLFYGYAPPADWLFHETGSVPQP